MLNAVSGPLQSWREPFKNGFKLNPSSCVPLRPIHVLIVTLHKSSKVGNRSIKETGWSFLIPALVTPGARIISGTRVESCHKTFLPITSFWPVIKPLSLNRTIIVLSFRCDLSMASRIGPIRSSTAVTLAR